MREIAGIFLRLGFLGFGGPLAVISMMEEETVSKRQWFTPQIFSQNYSLIKILPGPTATQMAVRLGWLRAGVCGGLLAGLLFVLPSFFIILALGILLGRVGGGATKDVFILGMQVSALAVILQGAWRLAHGSVKGIGTFWVSAISFILVLWRPSLEPLAIVGFGVLGIALYFREKKIAEKSQNESPGGSGRTLREGATALILVGVCLKAALLTFGTGLAIIPLLQHDVVEKFQLVSHPDFMQAMALGQITPGPFVITVTWIGYKALGIFGAVLATIATFGPGFLISLFALPWFEKKWGHHPALEKFYAFVVPSVVGAMFAVTVRLMQVSLKDTLALSLFLGAAILVFWKRTPSWIVIPLFGLIALFVHSVLPIIIPHLPI